MPIDENFKQLKKKQNIKTNTLFRLCWEESSLSLTRCNASDITLCSNIGSLHWFTVDKMKPIIFLRVTQIILFQIL